MDKYWGKCKCVQGKYAIRFILRETLGTPELVRLQRSHCIGFEFSYLCPDIVRKTFKIQITYSSQVQQNS